MKKLLFFIILLFPFIVNAESNITEKCKININEKEYGILTDDKYTTYQSFNKNDIINIKCDEKISYVYILFNDKAVKGSIDNQKTGLNGFLHELIKIDNEKNEINMSFEDDYSIAEIYLFNSENLPDWVERWEVLEKSDLLLFTSHADDEQLFFSGLMPLYVDKGKKIQVVYFTNHYNNKMRYHEQLEGLWTVGIKYYPLISTFPDAYSESLEGAISNLKSAGYTYDDALKYEVEAIRRYKPDVVVSHDEKGEYGHGQHILCTDVVKKAYQEAFNENYDAESLKKYGTHKISKLYLHLYEKNPIELNYDTPLASFNGKTAYEVSKEGFKKHYSQSYTWFNPWLNGENNEYTKATQIKKYEPYKYGLYYTAVGEDINKNDMFENVKEKEKPTLNIFEDTKQNIITIKDKFNNNKNLIINTSLILLFTFIILIILLKNTRKRRRK